MPESKIKLVSEYVDLSSERIKASFEKSKQSANEFAAAIEKMRNSMKRSMNAIRQEVSDSMQTTGKTTEEVRIRFSALDKTIKDFQLTFGRLRNILLLVGFAQRMLVRPVLEIVNAYAKQEDAINRLNNALRVQGTYSYKTSEDLIKMSEAFQEVTRYGDDAVQEVMQQLLSTGNVLPHNLQRATQAVLDFATATGRDLQTATMLVAKASEGATGELSRYGIRIDKNIPIAQRYNAVLTKLEEKFGGRAQADVKTYSGQMAQLGNIFNDVQEGIGGWILKFIHADDIIFPMLKNWALEWKAISEMGKKPPDIVGRLDVDFIEVEARIAHLMDLYRQINAYEDQAYKKKLGDEINLLKAQRGRLINAISGMKERRIAEDEERKATEKNQQLEQEHLKEIADIEEALANWKSSQTQVELDELNRQYEAYKDTIDQKLGYDEYYAERKRELENKLRSESKKLGEPVQFDTYVQSLKDAVGEAAMWDTLMYEYATGMTSALEDGFFKVISGDFESLGDVVASFGEQMLKTLLRITAQMITLSALTLLGFPVGVHTGGYMRKGIESSYGYGRKEFHGGGEVPATLLEGEGVLNKRAMSNLGVDNLDRLNRGESPGAGTVINNYYIQTIDERSFRERLQQHGDIYSDASERGIKDNASLRTTSMRFA